MPEVVYYFVRDGATREGPAPLDTLRAMAAAGELRPEHLVWGEGMPQWLPASQVAGVFTPGTPGPAPYPSAAAPPTHQGPVVYTAGGGGVGAYAGFWQRFCAAFVDGLLVGAAVLLAQFVLGGLGNAVGHGFEVVMAIFIFIASICGPWLYFALMESSPRQGTLGKLAMGLRVTDLRGNRISFGRATGRHFGKFVSQIILFIGYIMAAFTERKQALHDMMAGTLVVRSR